MPLTHLENIEKVFYALTSKINNSNSIDDFDPI